jgi:glycosyltransferase involved in cell wall biosynthesis
MRTPVLIITINDIPFFLSHRRGIAEAAKRNGLSVFLAAPPHEKSENELSRSGIAFIPWNVSRRGLNPINEMDALLSLCNIYSRYKPDIVHHVTQKPVIYGSVASMVTRVPSVVNALSGLGFAYTEGSGKGGIASQIGRLLHRFIHHRKNNVTIFQNPDDLNLFVNSGCIALERTRLIKGSGVDPTLYTCSPDSDLIIPWIIVPSRMLYDKGIGDVVEASNILRQTGIKFKIVLCGGLDRGNPRGIPESIIKNWCADGLVEWHGHVPDMVKAFHSATICCLPSVYREGIPKALIEAASCGLPIITTDTPGCREIVRHGDNGLLVPPRDPAALAEAMKTLLTDDSMRRSMGQRGRNRVINEFRLDMIIEQHMAIYRELLGDKWPVPESPDGVP